MTMSSNQLGLIATNDLAAITRGRAMQLRRLEEPPNSGCGWVPANLGIGPFGHIVADGDQFGSTGDLRLIPDVQSRTLFTGNPDHPPLTVMLADTIHLDGSPWECCPRTFLRDAIRDFREETGLRVFGAFEHEFQLVSDEPNLHPFSIERLLSGEPWGSELVIAADHAGLQPENWLPEYGEQQWEFTVSPAYDLDMADRAILLRDLIRYVSKAHGRHASFSPVAIHGGGGNGVHVHLSLRTDYGAPATFDAGRPGRMSEIAGQFAAGILKHSRALAALTASSVVSYQRLKPGAWSAGNAFLGEKNREAALRICPTHSIGGKDPAHQFNLEYRVGDATSNPWIYLGSLIRAGLEGIRAKLPAPVVVDGEVQDLTPEQREAAGVQSLPSSLPEALSALRADDTVMGWFDPKLINTFFAIKDEEMAHVADMTDEEVCDAYAVIY